MKKFLLLLMIASLSLQVSAKLKEKDLVGKWKYTVETGQETWTGVFHFTNDGKKLSGKVITDDGNTLPFSKIEIRDNDVLYLELQTDYDTIKITLTVDKDRFKGTGTSSQGEAPVTGEKINS